MLIPGSRPTIFARFVARRPWLPPRAGEVVIVRRKRLRVLATATTIEHRANTIEHRIEVTASGLRAKRSRRRMRELPSNVIAMPLGDDSVVADFLRYHVLVRTYGGDPEAWLARLERGGGDEGDVRFARWIRSRLRSEPELLTAIRRMVDTTPFWGLASSG
ncbi:MAG TPA: hypothetical protein VGR02_07115 [Thermoanaerobaculia bacterium]|nr:hypothetical protein [Thermoanaerobaculia bacterium]